MRSPLLYDPVSERNSQVRKSQFAPLSSILRLLGQDQLQELRTAISPRRRTHACRSMTPRFTCARKSSGTLMRSTPSRRQRSFSKATNSSSYSPSMVYRLNSRSSSGYSSRFSNDGSARDRQTRCDTKGLGIMLNLTPASQPAALWGQYAIAEAGNRPQTPQKCYFLPSKSLWCQIGHNHLCKSARTSAFPISLCLSRYVSTWSHVEGQASFSKYTTTAPRGRSRAVKKRGGMIREYAIR